MITGKHADSTHKVPGDRIELGLWELGDSCTIWCHCYLCPLMVPYALKVSFIVVVKLMVRVNQGIRTVCFALKSTLNLYQVFLGEAEMLDNVLSQCVNKCVFR